MKTFREMMLNENILEEAFSGEHAEIANKKNFNPNNPEVLVKGVGKYKLDSLKDNIIKKLESLTLTAKAGEFATVDEMMNPKAILSHFIKAILDVEKELNTPNIKRKITLMQKESLKKQEKKKIIKEVAPSDPEIEKWIMKVKPSFKKEYGNRWKEVLYAKAWSMYNLKNKK